MISGASAVHRPCHQTHFQLNVPPQRRMDTHSHNVNESPSALYGGESPLVCSSAPKTPLSPPSTLTFRNSVEWEFHSHAGSHSTLHAPRLRSPEQSPLPAQGRRQQPGLASMGKRWSPHPSPRRGQPPCATGMLHRKRPVVLAGVRIPAPMPPMDKGELAAATTDAAVLSVPGTPRRSMRCEYLTSWEMSSSAVISETSSCSRASNGLRPHHHPTPPPTEERASIPAASESARCG